MLARDWSAARATPNPIPDEPPDIVLVSDNCGNQGGGQLPVITARLPLSDVKSRSLTVISVIAKGVGGKKRALVRSNFNSVGADEVSTA